PKLIRKSDLVFSNSEFLRNYSAKYNKHSYYVGQGCDIELIKETDTSISPDDLENIKRPLIGYIGALTASRLDIELMIFMATAKPQWNFVLVGSEDEDFRRSKLHSLSNVIFLGPKNLEHVFQYINAFDVCINPQAVNDLTIGNYPRKIDEYLAMGKPIVATKTETMSIFSDYVSLATNGDEFIEMVDEHLRRDQTKLKRKRIELAFSHSWESCVLQMSEGVTKYSSSN